MSLMLIYLEKQEFAFSGIGCTVAHGCMMSLLVSF